MYWFMDRRHWRVGLRVVVQWCC